MITRRFKTDWVVISEVVIGLNFCKINAKRAG